MKKIIFILLAVFMLAACDQIIEAMSWFLNVSVSQSGGTPQTEFIFTANTNDAVSSWYVNGEKIQPTFNGARVAVSDSFKQVFPVGDYTVSAMTASGKTDEINIKVRNIIFKMSASQGAQTTDLYFDYPYLAYNDTLFNIETEAMYSDLIISHIGTDIIINMSIEVDYIDVYYFKDNNLMIRKAIDSQNMNEIEFQEVLELLYPEKFDPDFLFTRYRLQGRETDDTTLLYVYPDRVQMDGQTIMNENADKIFIAETKYLIWTIEYDFWDQWLFSGNMYDKIGINMNDMSYDEFIIVADILRRYPETSIWDLQAEYNPQ